MKAASKLLRGYWGDVNHVPGLRGLNPMRPGWDVTHVPGLESSDDPAEDVNHVPGLKRQPCARLHTRRRSFFRNPTSMGPEDRIHTVVRLMWHVDG